METKENQSLVVKSNNLVEASYRLTSVEQKIILTLVSVIKKEDTGFQRYRFKISEFLELMGIKDQSKYKQIPEIAEGLMKKILTIQEGNNIIKVAWLSGVKVLHGEGIVEMEFSPYLKPYLLQLKKRFTSYALQDVIQLKSAYSVRIYELLKQYESLGQRKFKLEELRYILAIQENEYKLYHQFKQRILQPSQKEIGSKTDISFDFEEIKEKRKVIAIKFYIHSNKTKALNEVSATSTGLDEEEPIRKVIAIMYDHKVTDLEAKKIYDSSKGDLQQIEKVYNYFKSKRLDSFIGTMISMVKPGVFQEPMKNNGKESNINIQNSNYKIPSEQELLSWEKNYDTNGEEYEQEKINQD